MAKNKQTVCFQCKKRMGVIFGAYAFDEATGQCTKRIDKWICLVCCDELEKDTSIN